MGLACVEVAADSRRQGLGTRIVEASIAWARQHGADKAYLQTMADNAAAIALYEPYGFHTHHIYLYLTAPSDGQGRNRASMVRALKDIVWCGAVQFSV